LKALCDYLLDSWDDLDLAGVEVPDALSCLLRTPRFRASSHVLLFLFAPDSGEPVLVAKTPRLPGDNSFIEREATNLQALALVGNGSVDGVPRVVVYRDWHGAKLLVQTALPGRPMSPALVRKQPRACLQAVMRWVTKLHQESRAFPTGRANSMGAIVTATLGVLERTFSGDARATDLVEQTRAAVRPLAGHVLPRVFEHGDLSSPNILMNDTGRLGVVDWELANPAGVPAADVFFFLTYMAFALGDATRTQRQVEAFSTAFFGPRAWARRHVMDYAQALGLPASSLPHLFVLCWARYLATLATRLYETDSQTRHDSGAFREWLTSNRYYALWNHTLNHLEQLDL
jgi:aminoglycoside phosphotransferase (APT) family kinase protein